MSKIVFESTFPSPLRVRLADSVIRLYTMQKVAPEFKLMMEAIIEVCGLKDCLTGDNLIKSIDRDQINPCFVFTRLSAYKNREKYNRELRALIQKLEELALSPLPSAVEEADLR